jgi:hypothetical protein
VARDRGLSVEDAAAKAMANAEAMFGLAPHR